jgi:hypothetical protein
MSREPGRAHESTRAALALLLVLALAACGNLTAGGFGDATVVVSGDAPEESAPPAYALLPSPRMAEGSDDELDGELEVEMSIFLVAADGSLLPLTDDEVRVRVDLEGVEEPEVASRSVPATTYTGLRMVFVEIEAEVDAGLIIDGLPFIGLVDVEIEEPLTITKPLDLEIEEGADVELLIDLNAEGWLAAVNPVTHLVAAEVFADLVEVGVR